MPSDISKYDISMVIYKLKQLSDSRYSIIKRLWNIFTLTSLIITKQFFRVTVKIQHL